MATGAYQLAQSRAMATEYRDGEPTGRKWGPGTITVRNGLAQVKTGAGVVASMPGVASRDAAGRWVVTATPEVSADALDADPVPLGTTWVVTRSCACGGRR